MRTKTLFKLFPFFIFLLFSAMTCDEVEEVPPLPADVSGLHLELLDNSGRSPVLLSGSRCPKEAFMLRVIPEVDAKQEVLTYAGYELNRPITNIRIITLTDFNEQYPAGSDIYSLFRPPFSPSLMKLPVTGLWADSFDFVLLTYPKAGIYQFRVELEVGEGENKGGEVENTQRIFAAETDSIDFF